MDLSTTYMGLALKNPIVSSSSPLSYSVDGIKRLEAAGVAAVVMPPLFAEQIEQAFEVLDRHLPYGIQRYARTLSALPDLQSGPHGPEAYAEVIRCAKASVTLPLIASLNGTASGAWMQFARRLEQAGADGLEISLYDLSTDPRLCGEHIEQRYIDLLSEAKRTVHIPVAMKLSPFLSAPANMAMRLTQCGAGALVLAQGFHHPDSNWLPLLRQCVSADLALSLNARTGEDVLKSLSQGARVVMMTPAPQQNETALITSLLRELQTGLESHAYRSLRQFDDQQALAREIPTRASYLANYFESLKTQPISAH